ncbi:MAG: zinc ABC transporter substrate-binding protein [Armatimonadetes bacterium]|jgi:zinc transport system substrate-binding protein|nr:zinc ABC transporter substrate-binding protein [Armatimonadota bacterium]
MRSRKYVIYAIAILLILGTAVVVLLPRPGVSVQQEKIGSLQVMATTSLLECAIKEVGGKHVKVGTLIAPGSCPGHYDIRPEDMKALCSSKLLFTHGYEGFVPRMLESAGSQRPKEAPISVAGNWMLPSVYIQALQQVTRVLSNADPANSNDYRKSLAMLEIEYVKLNVDLKKELKEAGAEGVAALCSDQQEETVRWMGLNVVDVYPRSEQFTPVLLHHITGVGRKNKVRICVDNLQSGPTAGRPLARDIGASHVTLSNFPGGFPDTETWRSWVEDNVQRVIAGLPKAADSQPQAVN